MPSKTEEYLALAQRTANGLTRYWESWTDYLTTASRLYKYPFADQLMIYAQRPDATACADFDIWNNRMNRYVRRGSKGIALLDESSGFPRLHYVFDVSDTGVRRNSRDPEVWQLNDDLFQPVSEMLAQEYGIHHERLSQQIADIAGKLAESYWDNNSTDILAIVDGSFLMDYDDAGQELQFKSAAAISIMYTILERCGFEPEGYFDRDDFQAIYAVCHQRWAQDWLGRSPDEPHAAGRPQQQAQRLCAECAEDLGGGQRPEADPAFVLRPFDAQKRWQF